DFPAEGGGDFPDKGRGDLPEDGAGDLPLVVGFAAGFAGGSSPGCNSGSLPRPSERAISSISSARNRSVPRSGKPRSWFFFHISFSFSGSIRSFSAASRNV